MSVFSNIVRNLTGRGVGENIGAYIGGRLGGPVGSVIGAEAGGQLSSTLSRQSKGPETTTTRTVPSDMGPMFPQGPATNIEIDFRGDTSMPMYNPPALNPANFFTDANFTQANVIPFLGGKGGAIGTAVGVGTAFVMDLFTGQPTKMIITRKLQKDARMAAEFYNNDLDMVAEYLSRVKGKQYSQDNVVDILLKRFSNQGPYVTKAAVRKTRSTVRKLDTLCKLQADICKPTTRRTVRRRSSTATARAMAKA